jgi:hypothetical protein
MYVLAKAIVLWIFPSYCLHYKQQIINKQLGIQIEEAQHKAYTNLRAQLP